MTPRVKINRGIQPGHPVSPKLFILCTQILTYSIVNHPELKGITYFDYEFHISQFADDTALFLKDKFKKSKKVESFARWFSGENKSNLYLL